MRHTLMWKAVVGLWGRLGCARLVRRTLMLNAVCDPKPLSMAASSVSMSLGRWQVACATSKVCSGAMAAFCAS